LNRLTGSEKLYSKKINKMFKAPKNLKVPSGLLWSKSFQYTVCVKIGSS
jgi:hypothetical protein